MRLERNRQSELNQGQQKPEKWDAVHGAATPEERLTAFLERTTDAYAILQIRQSAEQEGLSFMRYEYLRQKGIEPDIDHYEVVYQDTVAASVEIDGLLERLFMKFNLDRPEDFKGHSMSVSDIVAFKQENEVSCYYVDYVGFVKLHNFIKPENYLKNAEMALEDDYGMLDGIINNGKAPAAQERCSVMEKLKEGRESDIPHKSPGIHLERELE